MGISERKEREKEQKRELIIDVAEAVFFEKGFESATMDEIAERAEYSKGTLYLYFKNKEELYIAISTRSMDIFSEIIDEQMKKATTGAEKLNAIKEGYLQFFLKHPDHMRVMLHAFRSPVIISRLHEDEKTLKAIMEKDKMMQQMIASAIVQSSAEGTMGDFPPFDSPESAMPLVIGGGLLLNGIFQQTFDLVDQWGEQFPMKAEEVIRMAYKLLRF